MSDPRMIARIVMEYQLVTDEQLEDCLRHPEARIGLGEVMAERGYITVEQLEWLWRAEAYYVAQANKEKEATRSTTPVGGMRAPTTPVGGTRTPAATSSRSGPADTFRDDLEPAKPVKAKPRRATLTDDANAVAERFSTLGQRERQAELDAAREPALEIDRSSAGPAPPQAVYRMRGVSRPEGAPAFDQTAPSIDPPEMDAGASKNSGAVAALLKEGVAGGASDVHLHAGLPPLVRVNGDLAPLPGHAVLDAATTAAMAREVLSPDQREVFRAKSDLDFAYAVPGLGRFRANAYRQQRGVDLVFRVIPPTAPSLAELAMPDTVAKLVDHHQGLVLCTGPAGCGKSTTMAALLDRVNRERSDHILTIEDPIEFVHRPARGLVRQRQVVSHTQSFARALRAALREDPDVIGIGELRDLETISLAMTAAETGHLVVGTLHTDGAIRTINRVLDAFPPAEQAQARVMFSESLRGVVSQKLVKRADGKGRVAALEILLVNHAVSNLIREAKQFQIKSVMQMGRAAGMRLLDDSLRDLVTAGTITKEEAKRHADNPGSFS